MRENMPEVSFSSLQVAITNFQATMCSNFRSYCEIYELRQCAFVSDRHIGNAVQVQQYLLLLSEQLTSPYYINLWC